MRYELGDTHGAVEALQQSDRLLYDSYRRTRVRQRTYFDERQFGIGHLEVACATRHQALDDYPMVQSGRADERVKTMFSLLRPHLKNATARDLHDRARIIARQRW